jgi:alpha-tubulin suppressor-like RCC1 family protein
MFRFCKKKGDHQLDKYLVKRFSILSKGNGVYGALGQGDSLRDSNSFKEIFNRGITMFSAGWGHSAAVTETGKLLVFGRPYDFSNLMHLNRLSKVSKTFAQFVSRSTNSRLFGSVMGYYPSPFEFEGIENVQSVSCSAGLTLARTGSGDLHAFGLNRWRQCGVPFENDDMMHVYEPTRILGLPPCVDSDTGLQHCIALTNEGYIYTWGKANRGQLGRGYIDEMFALSGRVVLKDSNAVESPLVASHVCCGFSHSAAIGMDGAIYIWGKGFSTIPKVGTITRLYEDQLYPRRIDLPNGRRAVSIMSRLVFI